MQEGRPIEFASKSLSSCQRRYAQIEKELLAVYFGCSRFHFYTYGRDNVTVETDHRPLIGLMHKDIDTLSPRLAALRLKLMPYSNCVLKWRPGNELIVADTLSRSCPEGFDICEDLKDVSSVGVHKHFEFSDVSALESYVTATDIDEELQIVKSLIRDGWPKSRKCVPKRALPYWNVRDLLTVDEHGLVYYGNRLVIPVAKRSHVIEKLHSAHQGVTKTMLVAKNSVYWPGLCKYIEDKCLSCTACQSVGSNTRKEPMLGFPVPQYPFQVIGMDLFYLDSCQFLILVDYLSKFPFVHPLEHTNTTNILSVLKRVFSEHGIPEKIISDNGAQFTSAEFLNFCEQHKIAHSTSSPIHQQGNGQTERMVAVVKRTIKKCIKEGQEWWCALFTLRNTPIDTNMLTPAQILQGRQMRSCLDIPGLDYQVKGYAIGDLRNKLKQRKNCQKFYYDNHAGSDMSILQLDQTVRFRTARDDWIFGKISQILGQRSYVIEAPSGQKFRRNRRDIRVSYEKHHSTSSPYPGNKVLIRGNRQELLKETSPMPDEERCDRLPEIPSPPQLRSPTRNPLSAPLSRFGSNVVTRSGRISKAPTYLKDYVT
ncbi:Uncharacterised protein r2_g2308 [Pycnogonum litorale]